MNQTVDKVLSRLPNKPLMMPADVAAALGLKSTSAILIAIESGNLEAVRTGNRYIISKESAEAYIRSCAVRS